VRQHMTQERRFPAPEEAGDDVYGDGRHRRAG
jgi:hypothetical protein